MRIDTDFAESAACGPCEVFRVDQPGTERSNILKWLGGSSEFIYRWHEQYNVAVHNIAQTANVKLIDIRSAFLERRDYCNYLSDDGIHPNETGHALIAGTVVQQFEG